MQEPSASWRRQRGAEGEIDVLVLGFDQGVEIHLAGELGVRIAHWETRAEFDPEAQRAEVARALEWGRVHDQELRAGFRSRQAAILLAADVRRYAKDVLAMPTAPDAAPRSVDAPTAQSAGTSRGPTPSPELLDR